MLLLKYRKIDFPQFLRVPKCDPQNLRYFRPKKISSVALKLLKLSYLQRGQLLISLALKYEKVNTNCTGYARRQSCANYYRSK